jgi:protein-S-isoprenylcysteine O-methyltransferase Ste14
MAATAGADSSLVRPSALLHLLGSRGLPTFVFAMMALLTGLAALHATSFTEVVFHVLSATLWLMFVVLVNIRPTPLRRGASVIGVVAAVSAQAAIAVLGVIASESSHGTRVDVGNAVLFLGLLFSIASVVVLGRCFGVLPDVRGMVTRGPYRIVRHPLYLGELMASLGIVIGASRWFPALLAWLLCLALQLVRTHFEESSLRAQFPEYGPYARQTKRLIPGLV